MFTKKQLDWIIREAGQGIGDDDLDRSSACIHLRVEAERLLNLICFPDMRVLQDAFDRLTAKLKK